MKLKAIKSALPPGDYFFSGSWAIVEGAIAAGCNCFAGYPITPVNEPMERMAARLTDVNGVFMQMEDEIGSICFAIGAVWAGAKAMTVTSGPGFSLMQEGIGYAYATETPIVIVDGQRTGPSSGVATGVGAGDIMQARWGTHGDYQSIAFYPWSVQETYDLTISAFNYAERYRNPVILLTEATLVNLWEKVHVNETVNVFERIKKPGNPVFGPEIDGGYHMPAFGEGERISVSGTAHTEWGNRRRSTEPVVVSAGVLKLQDKIVNNKQDIIKYETYHTEEEMDVLVISYGFIARSSLFAVRKLLEEGKKVGMLRLISIWPFADTAVKDIGAKAKKIFVPEMNMGQVAGEVMKYAHCDVISYPKVDAEVIYPDAIIRELRRIL